MHRSNAATVLHRHLKALADFSGRSATNSWQQAWDTVLSPLKWLDSVGDLLGLHATVVRAVRSQRGVDAAEMLLHSGDWRQAILLAGVPLDKQIAQTSYRLNPSAVSALYQISVAMEHWPQPLVRPVADDKIDDLANAVADLRQQVLSTPDLEPDLVTYLLDLIEKIQHAVDRRNVLGDQPLRDIVTETVGNAAANPTLWDRAMASKVGQAFGLAMAALAAVAGLIGDVELIADATAKVIHELHAPAPQTAIEGGNQRQLTGAPAPAAASTELPGPHAANDPNVVDAEVVEDEHELG